MPAPKGSLNGEKHGGYGAIKHIHNGDDFRGMAAEAENNVKAELECNGLIAVLKSRATRLQAAADIFYGLLLGAAESGSLERFERFTKTYGWLAASAMRAWLEYSKLEKDAGHPHITAIDVLSSIKAVQSESD